jgi:hypothetical protein
MLYSKKEILILTIIFLILLALASCSKKTPEEITKKIEEKSDTLSHKLGRDVDTVVKSLVGKDTIFNNAKITEVDVSSSPSKEFRKRNNEVFSHYIDIKNKLEKDDSAGVKDHAKEMRESLQKTDSLKGTEKLSNWNASVSSLQKVIRELEAANTLDKQRPIFNSLTESMLGFIKKYGLYNKTIYYMQCDNAASVKNAAWIVDNKDTDNPYYGKNKTNEQSVPCYKLKDAWKFD